MVGFGERKDTLPRIDFIERDFVVEELITPAVFMISFDSATGPGVEKLQVRIHRIVHPAKETTSRLNQYPIRVEQADLGGEGARFPGLEYIGSGNTR